MTVPVTVSTPTTTATGPMSESRVDRQIRVALENVAAEGLRHTAALVEQHRIEILATDMPGDARDRIEAAKAQAQRWANAHGVEIHPEAISGSSTRPGSAYNGVVFTVTVGKGDIHLDQRVPGVLDSWRWSARFEWWRKVFNRMDGRQGRHLAEVSTIRTTTYDPHQYTGERPLVAGPTFGGGGGGAIVAGPGFAYPGEVVLDSPPPWARRGMGWDEDDEQTSPMGEGLPPGLR